MTEYLLGIAVGMLAGILIDRLFALLGQRG